MSRVGAKDERLRVQTLVQHGTCEMTKIFAGIVEEGQKHHTTHKHRRIVGMSVA